MPDGQEQGEYFSRSFCVHFLKVPLRKVLIDLKSCGLVMRRAKRPFGPSCLVSPGDSFCDLGVLLVLGWDVCVVFGRDYCCRSPGLWC